MGLAVSNYIANGNAYKMLIVTFLLCFVYGIAP